MFPNSVSSPSDHSLPVFSVARSSSAFAPAVSEIKLPMTRNDIADYLGLTIETVSRTLTRLRAEGVIQIISQSELGVPDAAALEGLAGGLG